MRFPTILSAMVSSTLAATAVPSLIPFPSSFQETMASGFTIGGETRFIAKDKAARDAADFLAARLRISSGHDLPVQSDGNGISFVLDPSLGDKLGPEGYLLETSASGVDIRAAGPAGLFYAGRTLLQLLPAEACSPANAEGVKWDVPAVKIEDRPRFAWRGFMLDESRHFLGVDHVKRLLDTMALHKLNRFHWHLTDDEGWRIEIKSYPKLTTIGAWRGSECALPNARQEKKTRYGGFYTQDQLREIVAYAKARHIEIMPEVDVPGHSLAILTAYPELMPEGVSGGVSAQGFKGNALSPAKEETYKFIEAVFDELKTIFPFEYVHIGGDEVNENAWKNCPEIRELMEREKLANLREVQLHFTKRMEKIFAARGKKIFGWNEILDDRLDRGTGIMAWTGSGPGYEAARMGFPVVMVPAQHTYLDMVYPGSRGEPHSQTWAGAIDDARVYSFDPLGGGGKMTRADKDKIMGVQAALWTEFVEPWKGEVIELPTHSSHADYKTWPRLAALAEVGWTPQEKRNYEDYAKRLGPVSLRRLGFMGIHYRMPVPTASHQAGKLTIQAPFPGADVRYTFDGSIPTASSTQADGSINLAGRDVSMLRARTFLDGRGSRMLVGSNPQVAAGWNTAQLAGAQDSLEFDLSAEVTTRGIWRARFDYTGGAGTLKMSGAELLVNGTSASKDWRPLQIGDSNWRGTWRFDVPAVPPGAEVLLRAHLEGNKPVDSKGTITLFKSDHLEPALTVNTNLTAAAESHSGLTGDWDDTTHFSTAGYPEEGGVLTWEFAEPLAVQFAGVVTGERGTNKAQAVGAVLEYLNMANEWLKHADFTYGNAEGTLPAGTMIQGLRLRFTTSQNSRVIIHDPVLR